MGSCLSKKTTSSSSPYPLPDPSLQTKSTIDPEKYKPGEDILKKEIFIIKHRKSHEIDSLQQPCEEVTQIAETGNNASRNNGGTVAIAAVRTSSCTKEEVDAILIQCGRLSRSSSTGKAAVSNSGGSFDTTSNPLGSRKYSGSKRSYDFDNEIGDKDREEEVVDDDEAVVDRIHRHRQRHRQSRAAASASPHGRRRTPSRERDQQQQRSGSRERGGSGGGGGGRRVSRSPGRRSESPITTSNGASGTTTSGNVNNRPGKMVSVPATVSSLTMDKSNNGGGAVVEPPSAAAVKRIQVKRNVGEAVVVVGSRSVASPRSRSPARTTNVKASNENQNRNQHQQQQPLSLSRSNSRKAEQSPYRRNPLSEIDSNQAALQKPIAENVNMNDVLQGTEIKSSSSNRGNMDMVKGLQSMTGNVAVTVIPSGVESHNPITLTRSRSSRRSRDLDNISSETLLNPPTSYTALLLEDIQNFHQKNTPAFSLPPCVTKACSILEAVADLNSSSNSSNLSSAISKNVNNNNSSVGANNKKLDTKDPVVESEVVASDDLMEPSFHKYVTVRRGAAEEGDMEEEESSGSNSFVGGQQHWLSSSSWEPNSADSTDCWTSSRTNDSSPLGIQRNAFSESGRYTMDGPQRKLSENKRVSDNQRTGIGRGRVCSGRDPCALPITAAAST